MEVDSDNGLLSKVASGCSVEKEAWPALRSDILSRLDSIAHNDFPIPKLPPPPPAPETTGDKLASPQPSSPPGDSSQEVNKENAPAESLPATQPIEGTLPKQLADMLFDITSHLQTFDTYPPHTIQRLADLILQPHAHYKALAPYLHAVDRTVQVTSGTNIYPLPPPIPDMSSMHLNGEDVNDPAVSVAWSNPTTAALGTDEALGGALLTPIPWLTRRSPDSGQDTPGAQIHSESTETIDGPNGVGSIETVSVSVNGIPSTGHARGVTQGELLRQEQRAGVVPVSQLSRAQEATHEGDRLTLGEEEEEDEEQLHQRQQEQEQQQLQQAQEEEEETPHARGPEEIGVDDTGPQSSTTSYVGEGGLEMQGIDVEAAVGRKHDEDEHKAEDSMDADGDAEGESEAKSPSAESVGTKREAEQELEGDSLKKVKENGVEGELKDKDTTEASGEDEKAPTDETNKDDDGDKMDTE